MSDPIPVPPPDTSSQPFPPPAEPVREYPFWTYQDLAVMTGLGIAAMVVATLLVGLVTTLLPASDALPTVSVLVAQFLTYGIWFLGLYLLIHLHYRRPFWPSLAWVRSRHPMSRYVMYGPLLAFAVGLAGSVLQTPEIEMPMLELLKDRWSVVLIGVFAVSLGPLCEELAFRGFLLPLLARSWGPSIAVLVTSLVFAAMHGPQYGWSWRHVFLITCAGIAFGVVRLRTGSTAAATAMHATYNLTFFVAFVAQWGETMT